MMEQTAPQQTLDQQLQFHHQQQPPSAGGAEPYSGSLGMSMSFSSCNNFSKEEEEMTRSALSNFRAKEEEIEKKKMIVREKVQAQLGRVEDETKRLATIREELEGLADPMRKDIAVMRKKIDQVNKDLKPLGQSCQRKEKEYKDALDAFNDKNKEKVQLITKLTELLGESEKARMKRLDELSKTMDSLYIEKL